ncbi:chorismate synthase [Pelodictyon phaeoclathratiforme]|uniref:Chorismate synthase n=1 Tax=Pelodictyon phaeoclathratiforme (strain DSM 5477 / BU-1) TaxID=324925 RepID=AROC_PELPB|nr:chorismate synthase [Pelodictyon phaeoclathratiforme]B4SFH4.1 RecName: Full=Chorismate synthase; Short=CS; AltName: Full=5-enolpyruvylshikimate-3-phosphate phospholyase [Pelodictyon phaeoclathratiforme BU-1]ACF43229.1 Chorismate synthase [Pelodictyon phaeoclathratiforme BU-1]MBV5290052.1 chorismate synthase [Pelodictyon phaeoclathratiforme]
MIRYFTAGESHGPALSAIVEGMPAGITITPKEINTQLARRQQGHGRGGRMKIESDKAEILSGVRFGKTIGSPITLVINNRDWQNWTTTMAQFEKPDEQCSKITIPRPGHADLAGRIKYGFDDIRPVIERSSARETAARVAAGTVARLFLKALGIEIGSYISAIGSAAEASPDKQLEGLLLEGAEAVARQADLSPVRMLGKETETNALAAIDGASERGDTLGGIIEIFITGVPPGFGSYVQHDRRLDAALAAAIISIQAIKGVEIGTAFENARKPGSEVHDEFHLSREKGVIRKTNRAGGLEGSMSSGQTIHLRAAMKPISSLVTPLLSFDVETLQATPSRFERSDTCAVPAAGVVAEAVLAPVIANALLEKLGGDHLDEIRQRLDLYRESIRSTFHS